MKKILKKFDKERKVRRINEFKYNSYFFTLNDFLTVFLSYLT